MAATSLSGKAISRAGSWISPPPPATESTKPAEKAATKIKTRVRVEISLNI
jgi:hypothetical protein